MLHTYSAGASRRALVLAGILGLHFAVFLIVASIRVRPPIEVEPDVPPIIDVEPPKLDERVWPDPPVLGEFAPEGVPEPDINITFEQDQAPAVDPSSFPQTGSGPDIAPVPDVVIAPTIAMRGKRLAALIDSCYPPGSRRDGEEGKAVVRLAIGPNAKLVSWRIVRGTGFARLDAAVPCVVEKLVFAAGSRNGQAALLEVMLPIVFRLN